MESAGTSCRVQQGTQPNAKPTSSNGHTHRPLMRNWNTDRMMRIMSSCFRCAILVMDWMGSLQNTDSMKCCSSGWRKILTSAGFSPGVRITTRTVMRTAVHYR